MKTILKIAFLYIIMQMNAVLGIAQESNIQMKLESSIGGIENWQNTKFLLFSCTGNDNANLLNSSSDRSLLWNRETGECRFEGQSTKNEKLVYLFNFKRKQPLKLFVNAVEIKTIETALQRDIQQQVNEDLKLLLLPLITELKGINFTDIKVKLLNNEKLLSTFVSYDGSFYDGPIKGNLLINENTGEIKAFENTISMVNYQVDQYKDAGSGLKLPTSFIALNNKKKSCTFTTVSTFEHVEASKFTEL
ncbi:MULTISPECIES: hypothetical protein [Sphingobacterium]|jgi:hypothetical protein|uniref:Uncharacterized protein n=1 Tax=Sphingobacterium kitahiroshimense TaxID=470446 RepID=A0ABV0BRY3_9SPHI|nr:hypothetical protein [Sphingobacterium sp. JUb56]MBB2953213.1 hypothetical protein [Sphingobacterium sp. JUb56]